MTSTLSWPLSELALGAWLGVGSAFCLYCFLVGLLLKQRWLAAIIPTGVGFLYIEWMFFTGRAELFALAGLSEASSLLFFGVLTTASTTSMAALFTRHILKLSRRAASIDVLLKRISILPWIAGVAIFWLPPNQFSHFYYGTLILCAAGASYAHWKIWRMGSSLDRLIGPSWILMGPALLAWFGRNLGVLPNSEVVTIVYLSGFLGNLVQLALSSVYILNDSNDRVLKGLKRVHQQKNAVQKHNQRVQQELRLQEDRLSLQKNLIRDECENKKALFTLISHDVRGPLAYAEHAVSRVGEQAHEHLTPANQKLLAYTVDSLHQTLLTLDRLMDVETLKSHDRVRHSDVIRLAQLVNARFLRLSAHAQQQKVTLSNLVAPEILVRADTLLIETLIDSLVSNAVKHTKAGEEVIVSAKSESPEITQITVANTVSHMPPTQIQKIDRSIKGNLASGTEAPVTMQNTSGSLGSNRGAGLYLIKSLIKAYNGEFTYYIEDRLLSFRVRLPTPKNVGVLAGFPPSLSDHVKKTATNLCPSCVLLEESNPNEIVALATHVPLSLVFVYLDAKNHETGLDLIATLRRNERMEHTQIAFATSSGLPDNCGKRQALRLGADLEIENLGQLNDLKDLLEPGTAQPESEIN